MRTCFVVLAVYLGFFGACCDRETRRIQPHWLRAGQGYVLDPINVVRQNASSEPNQVPFKQQYGIAYIEDLMAGNVRAQDYGFWLDVTNKGGNPIRLVWPEARYVDEAGKPHEVYAQERGSLPDERDKLKPPPPQPVSPGQRVRPTVVPIYKQYLVASGCRNLYPYSEPLIPSRLDDKNEPQMKAYVADLAKRKVRVKLVLPVEIDGVRYDYAFSFVLRDRWADLPKE